MNNYSVGNCFSSHTCFFKFWRVNWSLWSHEHSNVLPCSPRIIERINPNLINRKNEQQSQRKHDHEDQEYGEFFKEVLKKVIYFNQNQMMMTWTTTTLETKAKKTNGCLEVQEVRTFFNFLSYRFFFWMVIFHSRKIVRIFHHLCFQSSFSHFFLLPHPVYYS